MYYVRLIFQLLKVTSQNENNIFLHLEMVKYSLSIILVYTFCKKINHLFVVFKIMI